MSLIFVLSYKYFISNNDMLRFSYEVSKRE